MALTRRSRAVMVSFIVMAFQYPDFVETALRNSTKNGKIRQPEKNRNE
jgi:hypothetical protein